MKLARESTPLESACQRISEILRAFALVKWRKTSQFVLASGASLLLAGCNPGPSYQDGAMAGCVSRCRERGASSAIYRVYDGCGCVFELRDGGAR